MISRYMALAGISAALMGACHSSPTEPEPDPGATLTVDASSSADWVFVDLKEGAAEVTAVGTDAGAAGWDLAFQVTKVRINGGGGGTGGAVAYCVCQNASATPAALMAMSLEAEGGDFDGVTASDLPPSTSWNTTAFDDSRWYAYNLTGSDHQIWPTYDVYLVRSGGETYKLQITGYYGTDGSPRQITFRYARLAGS